MDGFEPVEFTGFTESEAKAYLTIKHCQTDFDKLKQYSGTNPLLLLKWSRGMEKHIYISKVCRVVDHFVEHNLKIRADNPVAAVLTTISLQACKKYVVYAANQIELDENSKVEYCKTWLYKHRLTIMEEGILRFNFPILLRLLIEIVF